MNWEVLRRGYAAIAVEDMKKDSQTKSLSPKERRRWVENAGLARVAVENILGKKSVRFPKRS